MRHIHGNIHKKLSAAVVSGVGEIRKKPESTRWAIVISGTAISAALLFTFWVKDIPSQFARAEKTQAKNAAGVSIISPLESLKRLVLAFRGGADSSGAPSDSAPAAIAEENETPSLYENAAARGRRILEINLASIGEWLTDLAQ